MGLTSAWRKTFSSLTTGIFLLRIISFNTEPGPTEGSWSTSPTKIRRQPPGTAFSRWCIKVISSMEASSIIIASASSGSLSFLPKLKPLPSGWYSKRRCTVCAGCPLDSARRLAALPVGAASKMRQPAFSSTVIMPLTTVVLPVPGPPVNTKTPYLSEA